MVAIIGLFIILIGSITVIRIGAIALELTGLSPEVSSFQAQSAFSGTGFTTAESESIVNHPLRRKIIRLLILVGSAGIVSTGATLMAALVSTNTENVTKRAIFVLCGLIVLYTFVRLKIVYVWMKRWIVNFLKRMRVTDLQDYHDLLGLGKGFTISRMKVTKEKWIYGKKLKDLDLQQEGTTILGITRYINEKDVYLIPYADTVIDEGDLLTVYGQSVALDCLYRRPDGPEGEAAHMKRKKEHIEFLQLQEPSS